MSGPKFIKGGCTRYKTERSVPVLSVLLSKDPGESVVQCPVLNCSEPENRLVAHLGSDSESKGLFPFVFSPATSLRVRQDWGGGVGVDLVGLQR